MKPTDLSNRFLGERQGTMVTGARAGAESDNTFMARAMKETLKAAGGSTSEKERWLLAMLAQLREESPETPGKTEARDANKSTHGREATKATANEATAIGGSIPTSKDRVPPDLSVGKPTAHNVGGEGHEDSAISRPFSRSANGVGKL